MKTIVAAMPQPMRMNLMRRPSIRAFSVDGSWGRHGRSVLDALSIKRPILDRIGRTGTRSDIFTRLSEEESHERGSRQAGRGASRFGARTHDRSAAGDQGRGGDGRPEGER